MTMEVLADWVSRISNVVWNGLLLYLLVGTGIVFTIRTRFIQVRKFGAGWKHLFGHFSLNGEKAGKDGMSPFQALTTAIAAQVGTGNIAGAATALYSGGPGAIYCTWLAALLSCASIMQRSFRHSSRSLLQHLTRRLSSAALQASRFVRQCATALHAVCSRTRPAWALRRTHMRSLR